mmetsp:Transcript_25110/g.41679  ORF Transcript_25110/g.41679 Transcript_25110/m.41679 type:complete len:128 (+) Transcript_25110:113-496(+)
MRHRSKSVGIILAVLCCPLATVAAFGALVLQLSHQQKPKSNKHLPVNQNDDDDSCGWMSEFQDQFCSEEEEEEGGILNTDTLHSSSTKQAPTTTTTSSIVVVPHQEALVSKAQQVPANRASILLSRW